MNNRSTDQHTTIQSLKTAVHHFRKERGWLSTDQKDIAISITLEAAELLEHFQWVKTDAVKTEPRWRQAVGEEMADILFLILEMAHEFDIDISQAFTAKMAIQAKKYSVSEFNPQKNAAEQIKAYYRVKSKTRANHPFAHQVTEK